MLRSACAYAQSDQNLCSSLEYSMSVKQLTEHLLEVLSLKGSCACSSESTLVKMPHCWKSHVTAQLLLYILHQPVIQKSRTVLLNLLHLYFNFGAGSLACLAGSYSEGTAFCSLFPGFIACLVSLEPLKRLRIPKNADNMLLVIRKGII